MADLLVYDGQFKKPKKFHVFDGAQWLDAKSVSYYDGTEWVKCWSGIDAVFANNSWEQINSACVSGQVPSTWLVGDTKDITLSTGEVLTLQIWGKAHDDLTSGGKAGLTLGLKELMATKRRIHSNDYNNVGYASTELFTWLNGTLFSQLPSDLQSVIKEVNKKTSIGSKQSTIATTAGKIHFPSTIECFGSLNSSFTGEGTKYAIFTDNASRVKKLSNGAGIAYSWVNRSPTSTTTEYYNSVTDTGIFNNYSLTFQYGVCFTLCI